MSDTRKEPVEPINVTDETFEQLVLKSELPVVVDFWAAWCGPCRMIAPALDRLGEEFAGRLVVAKVDVDANTKYKETYAVMGIPHLIFFNKGQLVKRHVGAAPRAKLHNEFDAFLSSIGAAKKNGTPEQQSEFDAVVAVAEVTKQLAERAAGDKYRQSVKSQWDALMQVHIDFLKAIAPTLSAEDAAIAQAATIEMDTKVIDLLQKHRSKIYNDPQYEEFKKRDQQAIKDLNAPENEVYKTQMFADVDAASDAYDATVESARNRIFG